MVSAFAMVCGDPRVAPEHDPDVHGFAAQPRERTSAVTWSKTGALGRHAAGAPNELASVVLSIAANSQRRPR